MKTTDKQPSIAQIAKNAESSADKIIASSKLLREEMLAGRPNSSSESTTKGTLEAFKMLISGMPSPRV